MHVVRSLQRSRLIQNKLPGQERFVTVTPQQPFGAPGSVLLVWYNAFVRQIWDTVSKKGIGTQRSVSTGDLLLTGKDQSQAEQSG